MRVAIVSPYDPRPGAGADPLALRGGVEEALDRCASGLAAAGHEVTVVTSATRAGVEDAPDGVRLLRVKRHGALFRNPIAFLGRHVPPDADVVHVPATYPLVSDLIPWRESRRGRATVLDYHFDVHGTSAAMRLAASAHRALLRPAMWRATRIVVKSLDYARASPVLATAPQERLDWVPNGVDMGEFDVRAPRGDGIVCVGRLVPYKGVDVLLRAMPRIYEETGAGLTVVGDGPEAPRLRALAKTMGAPVRFLGRAPREDLPHLYAEARLSVLPSVNSQEAFGMALLESMAAGTPVVASDLPGVREVASLAGLTATPGDPQALADAVVEAWRAPAKLGSPQAIRERVAERYAWPAVVARLVGVYAAALRDAPLLRGRATPLLGRGARAGGPG